MNDYCVICGKEIMTESGHVCRSCANSSQRGQTRSWASRHIVMSWTPLVNITAIATNVLGVIGVEMEFYP